jgi:hypothetical protein
MHISAPKSIGGIEMSHNYVDQEIELASLLFRSTTDRDFIFELKRICETIDEFRVCKNADEVFETFGDWILDHLADLDPQPKKGQHSSHVKKTDFVESFWKDAFDADRLIDTYEDITETVIDRLARKDLLERRELALQLCPELEDELKERE